MFSFLVLAQTQPDAAKVLEGVSQTYKNVSTYELIADVTLHQGGTKTNLPGHVLFAFRFPSRYRMETEMSGEGSDDAAPEKTLIVYDGSALWSYVAESNEYDTIPAGELTDGAPGDKGDLRPAAMDHFMMWRYRSATDFAAGAKVLREEALELAGAASDCYVVTLSTKTGAYTWWVDKRTFRILREDSPGSSSVFTTVKLDVALPDDLFKFVPPPGARRQRN
ncbi:MAG TPA: hypothetical protein VHW09_05565 [Bryobacteraceae bacterium]|nr:hypothetical protein [Bryobacteraceae bacterium]